MSLSSNVRYGNRGGISFQLKPTGVRYFLSTPRPSSPTRGIRWAGRNTRNTNPVRDISTQYDSMVRGLLRLNPEKAAIAEGRLIAHAEAFYPEFTIPDDRMRDTYAWVAFPMIGASMKTATSILAPPLAVNLQVASGLRTFSIEEMVRTIFGEAPRQLQAAAAESLTQRSSNFVNIDNLTLASLLRGYLPPNQMAEVLRLDLGQYSRIQDLDRISAGEIRLLLRRFNPKRIMRLVSGMIDNNMQVRSVQRSHMLLRDAAHQYADARKGHPDVVMDLSRQFRSFEELHETITHEYRKLRNPNLDIPYDEVLVERLSNISLPDGARLVWPSCTHELVDWSSDKAMNNCIFSYGQDAVDGRSLLLGIVDASGKMVVNLMVRGRNVSQCYGKANQTCTDEPQLAALFQGLIEAEIINEESDHKRWVGQRQYWRNDW